MDRLRCVASAVPLFGPLFGPGQTLQSDQTRPSRFKVGYSGCGGGEWEKGRRVLGKGDLFLVGGPREKNGGVRRTCSNWELVPGGAWRYHF